MFYNTLFKFSLNIKDCHSLIFKIRSKTDLVASWSCIRSLASTEKLVEKRKEGCLARYSGSVVEANTFLVTAPPTPRASASRWKGFRPRRCSSKPCLERTNKPTMGSGSLGCDEIQLSARVHSCGGMRVLPNAGGALNRKIKPLVVEEDARGAFVAPKPSSLALPAILAYPRRRVCCIGFSLCACSFKLVIRLNYQRYNQRLR